MKRRAWTRMKRAVCHSRAYIAWLKRRRARAAPQTDRLVDAVRRNALDEAALDRLIAQFGD